MVNKNVSSAKLLFVLSNDYGELANAMYLVKGYGFQTVLLMPDRLFSINTNSLAVRHHRYRSVRDVTENIERERPDIVFLFSGYLYSINNIFDIETVEGLVRELRNGKHRIVTSDPFLGIMSELDSFTFSDRHPRKQWLTEHFAKVFGILKDVTHLYLVRGDEFAHTASVSFFNKNIIGTRSVVGEHDEKLAGPIGLDTGKKRWVFVLALEDYGSQVGFHGRARFDDILIDKLRQAAREGRQPVLVAPQVCITSIQTKTRSIEGAVFLPFCGYDVFMSLVLDAEYVFYWNVFSNSIPARVLNHLPLFFFDPGHMAHAMPPLFKVGVKRYYLDWEPVYLDQRGELASQALAGLASQQERAVFGARENFRRSPSPEEMVEKLLQGSGREGVKSLVDWP